MNLLSMKTLTDHAEAQLSNVGDPNIWQCIKADITTGRSQLFMTSNQSYIVLRIVGDELIFVAAVGQNGTDIMETVIKLARDSGLSGIRFYTARKGLSRLLKQFNPVEIQRVYRIDV